MYHHSYAINEYIIAPHIHGGKLSPFWVVITAFRICKLHRSESFVYARIMSIL